MAYVEMRRSGRTTRLVDQYVQELFTLGECEVIDHWWPEKREHDGRNADKHILKVFLVRLEFEHRITKNGLIINGNKIKLNNY